MHTIIRTIPLNLNLIFIPIEVETVDKTIVDILTHVGRIHDKEFYNVG